MIPEESSSEDDKGSLPSLGRIPLTVKVDDDDFEERPTLMNEDTNVNLIT